MAEYRAYILGLDGKIRKAIPLFCDEDEFAKEKMNSPKRRPSNSLKVTT